MRASPMWIRFVVVCLLCAGAGPAAAAGLRLSLWPVPPVYTGTDYSIGVSFEKEDRNDGIVHTGPFTFRTVLPVGLRYASFQGGGWTCSAQPDLRTVSCTWTGTLDSWNPAAMSVGINSVADYGLTPGPVDITGTLESTQVPLPPNPVCSAPPTTTGCATVATSIVTSTVAITGWGVSSGGVTAGQVAVWTGAPYEAGQHNIFNVDVLNIGFGPSNTPVELDFWLPPGVSYANLAGGLPAWTCAAQGSAYHVHCSTPYMYSSQNGYLTLHVQVAETVAVPGPLYVHAAIGNDRQLVPTSCVADPLQLGCARLQFHTRVPRVATMIADALTLLPEPVTLGQEAGPLLFTYRNIGEAAAGTTQLYVQLPPHFEYRGLQSSSPPATCTAQGLPAAGQVVVCGSSGTIAQGSIGLRVYGGAAAASPGPLPVVAAIELATAPNPMPLLQSCAVNPAQSFCAAHAVPTYFPCALQWADGIFCDGLQPFVRP
ncbi:hypothetical protein [Tahibacter caeni]|uniref:hypothetical protein n=1 Tax=Tahibacter caeni TaxID=1453545 RepID=UPI0021478280|nr:hypothetical protein [Tahibacter caeni]